MKPFKRFLNESNSSFDRKKVQDYLKDKAEILQDTVQEIKTKYSNDPVEMNNRINEIYSSMTSHLIDYLEKNNKMFMDAYKSQQYSDQDLMADVNGVFGPLMGNIVKPLPGGGISITHSSQAQQPTQQQATPGFFASQRKQTGGLIKPGRIVFQNIPQGATEENPLGREGMPESEYTKPDRFNNPPPTDFDSIFKSIFGP